MGGTIDNIIALRVLYMLTTPFTDTPAYKLGIIDAKGNILKPYSALNTSEQDAYTLLHRLVFRLKRIIEKVPVFNTQFLSYAAAYALIKECLEQNVEPVDLEHRLMQTESVNSNYVALVEEFMNEKRLKPFRLFFEDGEGGGAVAANNIATTPGIAMPPAPKLFDKPNVVRRKPKQTIKREK
jgi:hypothetical protein